MKYQCYLSKCLIGGLFTVLMLLPAFVFGAPYSVAFENEEKPASTQKTTEEGAFSVSTSRTDYEGHLVVYIIEPISRWDDNDGQPIDYAVIKIPFNEDVFISESVTEIFTWDATGTSFENITSDNIMVLAGLAGNTVHQGWSDPGDPPHLPFDAYYYDFAAAATPGVPGSNASDEEYTHTVLVETLSATW